MVQGDFRKYKNSEGYIGKQFVFRKGHATRHAIITLVDKMAQRK